jgi:hypothetical protein
VDFDSCCNDDTLNTDELQITLGNAFHLKAQLNGLTYAAVGFVQRSRLRVAPGKSRDRSNIVAFFVLLDDNVKIALHGVPPF